MCKRFSRLGLGGENVCRSYTETSHPDRSSRCLAVLPHTEVKDVIKQDLLIYIKEVQCSPEDGEARLERIEHHTMSAEGRRVAVQLWRATPACQELVAQPRPTAQTASKHTTKRTQQMATISCRRYRCSGWGWACWPITDVMGAPWSPKLSSASCLGGHVQRCRRR